MSKIRICTPVTGKTLDEFLANLQKVQTVSDLIELRTDYVSELTVKDVNLLKNKTTKTAIFTCRNCHEGGKFSGKEEKRLAIIQAAIDQMFDYVDIELNTIVKHPFKNRSLANTILSYHNFEETPNYWEMNKLIFQMNQYKPKIIKIATMVKEEYENVKLYRLMVNKPHTENRIIIGMGKKGTMTRILGPLLGNYLTYAATDYGETAPGQITIEKLKETYRKLGI
ncbi:type I 3-dehydroquinate dehydratase [Candidatus Roizmanbacteria bacterium RIFCSPLOWO2_02_FULL_41_9]|uniref:3-dehydroquinate dehydratase n=1 Tax=Candidatus Roizmanbacteria bacterium RIFCSPLOWO2_02_FULL_41_9 TaxID=1802077 RepID=A0A1F7JQW4_9BACT|nr:MAG: type I 3-dehydroquinate dehydratase [Candidatus Roizmanbacteria bacterium RIFCSPLOWO2_02_FULL_41_9]